MGEIDFLQFNQGVSNEYAVDLILCIDGTGSMKKMIDKVKETARGFYNFYALEMANQNKLVRDNGLRVKVIVFRDYIQNSPLPMEESRFFNLADPDHPSEQEEFNRFVDGIQATGGGDIPENALEALALALKSKWEGRGGRFRRHAILLFTDTCTYDLQNPDRKTKSWYPPDMPASLTELREIWEYGDQELAPYYSPSNGRLIIFAPPETSFCKENASGPAKIYDWIEMRNWKRTWVVPVQEDGGCADIEMKLAMNVLVGSFTDMDE